MKPFQSRVTEWVRICFGDESLNNVPERCHRFLEESLELVQSKGCTREEAHMLVDYVFDRPIGAPYQEIGGTIVTLAALCTAAGLNMENCGELEIARCWGKIEAIRAKQALKPPSSPLPSPSETGNG